MLCWWRKYPLNYTLVKFKADKLFKTESNVCVMNFLFLDQVEPKQFPEPNREDFS